MTEHHTLAAAITRGIDRGLRDVGADLTGCTPSLLSGWVIRELRAEGGPLRPAMTEPRTPTTAEIREEWIYGAQEVDMDGNVVTSADEAGAAFDRWLARDRGRMTLDDLTRAITHADHAWNEETGDWDPIHTDYARFLAEHIHAALEAT